MKSKLKWLMLGVLGVIFLLIVVKLWRIGSPGYSLYSTYTQVQAIAADPYSLDVMQVQPMVHQTHLDLVALQQELHPFYGLMRRLTWLPKIGDDVAAAPDLLALAVPASQAGDIAVTMLKPVFPLLADGETLPDGREEIIATAVTALAASGDDIERIQQRFEETLTRRAKIDANTLSPRLAGLVNRFDQGLPFLQLALEFAPVASSLLGATEARTYLLVAQNNDELRATGGFLSAVGTLTLDQGNIVAFNFEDVYQVDDFSQPYPEAPAPLLRYIQAHIWVFRDANWSPDYPTSVSDMIDLYHISRDTPVDGVIVVDQIALQQIVAALEPLTVPDWDEPVTAENVMPLIWQSLSPGDAPWSQLGEWWVNRKDFMGNLTTAMRNRVEESPGSVDWVKLIEATLTVLDARHAQAWLADPAAQQIIEARGWDGAIRSTAGDYLMVIDSNLGFNKVNAAAETLMLYQVDLMPGQNITAALTITHRNNSTGTDPCIHRAWYGESYEDIINRCYWDYLRVYTPLNSQLLRATPHTIPGENLLSGRDEPARVVELPSEGGKLVWGTLLLVARGKSLQTAFHYTLRPEVIKQTEMGWRYHLLLQKQAGTMGNKVQFIVQLPPETQLVQVEPPPDRVTEDGRLEFNLTLEQDREVEVIFE